jgi:hypothetical protein
MGDVHQHDEPAMLRAKSLGALLRDPLCGRNVQPISPRRMAHGGDIVVSSLDPIVSPEPGMTVLLGFGLGVSSLGRRRQAYSFSLGSHA